MGYTERMDAERERQNRWHERILASLTPLGIGLAVGVFASRAACAGFNPALASALSSLGTVTVAAAISPASQPSTYTWRWWWYGSMDGTAAPAGQVVTVKLGWLWVGVALLALAAVVAS